MYLFSKCTIYCFGLEAAIERARYAGCATFKTGVLADRHKILLQVPNFVDPTKGLWLYSDVAETGYATSLKSAKHSVEVNFSKPLIIMNTRLNVN